MLTVSCTVLADGQRILSCLALAVRYHGRCITTVEGLGTAAHKPNMAAFLARTARDLRFRSRAATGAQFCEVRVDPDTGEVRVSRWLGVFDVGTVINARTAAIANAVRYATGKRIRDLPITIDKILCEPCR